MTILHAGQLARAEDFSSAGRELAYAEITAVSAAFTAETDISGLSVTFTLDETRTVLVIVSALPRSTAASDQVEVKIADGSSTILQTSGSIEIPAANNSVRRDLPLRQSLAAGTHTRKVRALRGTPGTGTCVINGLALSPSFIQVLDITGS